VPTWEGFIRNFKGQCPLGRPRCRCENIKRLLKKVIWKGNDWNDLAQERGKRVAFLNTVMNFGMP